MKAYRYRIYQTEQEIRLLVGPKIAVSKMNRMMRVDISNYVFNAVINRYDIKETPRFELQQAPEGKSSTLTIEEIRYIHTSAKLIGFQEALIEMLESKGIRNEI